MALVPYRGQEAPEVTLTTLDALVDGRPALPHEVTAVALRVDGRELAVVISHLAGAESVEVDGLTIVGEVAVWDRAKADDETDILSLGVSAPLASADRPEQRLQWGYAAGGGCAYEAPLEGEVAIPRAKPGVEYVYRVVEVQPFWAAPFECGRWRTEE